MYKQAKKLCLLGATNEDLAKFFEVGGTTLDRWIKDNAEFRGAIKEGRIVADAEVANSLYRRAIGYEHPEDDIRALNGEIVITPTIKHYPPDPTSGIFWLKNRSPAKWREKVEIDPEDGQAPESKTFTFQVIDGRTDGNAN